MRKCIIGSVNMSDSGLCVKEDAWENFKRQEKATWRRMRSFWRDHFIGSIIFSNLRHRAM